MSMDDLTTPTPITPVDPDKRRRTVRRRWIGGSVLAVLAAVGIYLVFFVFAIHLIFVDEVVNEEGPIFTSGASVEEDNQDGSAQVQTMTSGMFMNRSHPTSGRVVVLSDGAETFLRFEDDFKTDNGPDLDVYLSTSPPDAPAAAFGTDFINLGDMKGNIGSQNYLVPAGTDLSQYSTVVIWCVRFNVVFGTASLQVT